jgi:amino acid adenylation domain-containing protein
MFNFDFDARSARNKGSSTMNDLLRKRALHQGNRLAYTFLVDGEAEKVDLTYGELDRRSRSIGASLQFAGATGERVLLLYPHGLEFIAAFWGCLYAGAIAVPAYPPRYNRSQLRLQKIIDDTQAAVALTTRAVLERVGRVFHEAPYAKNLRWLVTEDITGEWEEKWREPAISDDTPAMIQYTSGSTSDPKGVMVSHSNLLSNQRMIQRAFRQTEDSIIVGWLPLYHDMGLIGNVLQPLFLGARCVLMSPTAFLQKPSRWLQAISDYRATTSGGPNFAYDLCVRKMGLGELARLDLSSWTTAFNGSEPIFHETMERFAAFFATCGFGREAFYPCYGLAEATLLVSAGQYMSKMEIDEEMIEHGHSISLNDDNGKRIIVSCGQALPNERVVIVDPEALTQCPEGRIGEIWVSGPNVARGYWNRDHETEQTFMAYLEADGDGPFLRTGDLGYIKDGEIFVAGRIKDLIIIRGRNHYPQDIELTVQQSDPALRSGSCAAFSVERADEERLVIVAELSRRVEDPTPLIEGIREAVAREHEVQTHAIVLVSKGSIPKTTSGKIQRYDCRNKYRLGEFAAIVEWHENSAAGAKPMNLTSTCRLLTIDAIANEAIKTSLLSFLATKLNRRVERIDVDKSLLGYGVDSLTAIEVSHHLESRFGVVLPLANFLEGASIAQLAQQAEDRLKRASRDSRPSLAPVRNGATEHPLSYGQRSLWFLHQLAPLSGAYNVSSAARIRSALDAEALRRALQKIVDRHDLLRTTFLLLEGEPLQRVGERLEVSLLVSDASSWSDGFLDDYLVREAHQPFNLDQGPLLRVCLFRRSPLDHILLVVAHHIVVDLWSMGVLIHELGLFYSAEMDSTAAPLDPLPLQYADYVYWQRELLAGQEGERLRDYWQSKLAGDLGTLNLPTDRPRQSLQTFRGDSQPISLNMDLTQALRSLGQNHRATLYMTLHAVFLALLHRYTAQEDILVGSPMMGRNAADLDRLIGYFVNPVILRADLSGSPTFSAFLDRIRELTLSALAHQDYPFALLVERLQPERDPSRSPIFQVMFGLQKAPSFGEEALAAQALIDGAPLNFSGLSAESVSLRRQASYFDLSLFVVEAERGLKGIFEYNADLFDEWRIQRMAEHFRTLTEAFIANPLMRIHEPELLSAEEKKQVIVEFNRTGRNYESAPCIHSLIEGQVESRRREIAVVYEEERVSYEELNRRANQLARYLVKRGVSVEDRVGIYVERRIEMIIGLLGIMKAGAAYVPLDPSYPQERLEYILRDAAVKALLTQDRLKEVFAEPEREMIFLDSDWPLISRESSLNPELRALPENLGYVIYTSGSTGRPKGVAITHRGAVTLMKWAGEVFSEEELSGVLASTSICFDLSVFELMVPLGCGGKIVLAKNALDLPELRAAGEVRLINTVPSAVRELVGSSGIPESVETVNFAGEPLRNDLAQQIYEQGNVRRVLNLYGPTEDTTYSTWTVVSKGASEEPTLGRPVANTAVYILDREMRPAPLGIYGDIYISGEGLARCYLNRPGLTAEKFLPNPFGSSLGERLYRTGDIGRYLRDGNIEYHGREDHQVKVRGYRIELGEIERVLEQKEWIREAVVVVREEGFGDKRLVAYVVAERARAEEAKRLKEYLREKLPGYMVPSAIVMLEKLPLTPNGKLDRRALPTPDGSAYTSREYEAPVGATETALAQIWAEALKLERVSRNDHFFELGGHSLLAVRLIERMRRDGLQADVRGLYANPTLAALATAVTNAMGGRGGIVDIPPNRIPLGCERITPEMMTLVRLGMSDIERIVSSVPDGAANVQDIYPLAPLQEGILFHYQMTSEGDVYLMPGMLSFDTRARLEKFLQTLQAVIQRHDILRTAVLWEGLPEPVQVVYRRAPLTVEEINVEPTAVDVAKELRVRFDPRHYRLDIRKAPLIRVCIARDARNDRWVMLHLFHHLSVDHTSLEVLLQEIRAHLAGRAEQLPMPPPFRNFVAQSRLGVSREEHEAFFREMLAGVDEPTTPFGLINVQGDGSGIREARREVDGRLAIRLRQRARALAVSTASLYHLAWAQILARVSAPASRRDDVVFGTVLFGRMQGGEGVDRAPGMFNNTLPIRIRISGESMQESVRQIHISLAQLIRHEHAPLALAQRCSAVTSPAPLFSALLNYRHSTGIDPVSDASGEALPAWEGIEFLGGEERTNYPFCLIVDDLGEGFVLNTQVESPVDPERICAYLHTALEQLMETLERAPTTPVGNLDILPDSERHQLLVEWNETGRPYSPCRCISELFDEQARRRPDGLAVKCEQEQISYRELNEKSNQLARYLQELGVGPEVRVALCLERSIQMVVGLLGILKAGGAYVPIDPTYPDERLNMIVEDSEIRLLVTEARLAERCSDRSVKMICLDRDWNNISMRAPEDFQSQVEPSNAAYVIYTSGSTGRPKGVIVTHGSIHNLFNAVGEHLHFNQDDVWTMFHSYSFDFSVWEIWGALICGGTLVVAPYLVARTPEEFCELVYRESITILSQTPSAFRHFMKVDEVEGAGRELSLRAVVFGGEALESRTLKGWVGRHGDESPQLINMYGITETTVHTTYKRIAHEDLMEPSGSVIGRPLTNVRMYVFNERMQPAPVGVVGELYVGGKGVARGYLGREELTAERFVPAPYGNESGARIYKTGDLARYLSNGNIEYLGRRDHQVKLRGYRIELGEIEAALLQHEAIREAVVIAREEAGGDKRLVAYLVSGSGERLAMRDLRVYLREKLPDYMTPSAFVMLEKMPQTANGKLDRQALPRPREDRREGEEVYAEPRTPVEEILVGLFEEVLQFDRVGINDNFFEIGGHSLSALQLVSRVRNTFGVEIGVRSVFEEATVEGLARRIDEAMGTGMRGEAPPLVRVWQEGQRSNGLPLSFEQQRLWFIDQLEPDNTIYNIPGVVRLEGRLDLEVLGSAVNEIVRRHEVLRTRIGIEEGRPVQVIDEWEPRRFEQVDLTGVPREEREEVVSQIAREEAGTRFDLQSGPLLRVKVVKLEEEQHVMLFTIHHIVCDAWSMEVLARELSELYEAISEGNASPLPELKIQYADYAYWQRSYLRDEALEWRLRYWKKQLRGLPVLNLATDRPRPPVPSCRGASKSHLLPAELCKSLKALSRLEGVTPFMTLLATFKTLLYKYTAEVDIVVGTAALNRNRAETEPLIGCFVNMLPMRTDLSGNPRFRELLSRVREMALGVYAHQDMPFEKLVEEIQPERGPRQMPVFNIAFGMQNAPVERALSSQLKILPMAGGYDSARIDLSLWITESDKAMWARWNYSTDLFEEETITRMHGHFETLLSNIVAEPNAPLDKIEMLSDAERSQRSINRAIRKQYNYSRFKSVKPTTATLSED